MSNDGINSDQDQSTITAPSRLELGTNGRNTHPNQSSSNNHVRVQQTTAPADWEGEDITTSEYFSGGPTADENDARRNQHSGDSNWWNIINRVKEKQKDRSLKKSELSQSLPFYTNFESEATKEKSSGLYDAHEYFPAGSEEEEAQAYTKAAAEKVHTFLRQDSSATYTGATK